MTDTKTGTVVKPETASNLPANERHRPAQPRVPSELDKYLHDAKSADGDPDVDPYELIIRQVLAADSPAAVLTPVEALQGRDLVNVPLMLLDFQLNQSEFDTGSPFYASMAVLTPGGDPAVANCGHKKVLAQLVKLKQFNEFPYRVMFHERGVSKQGTPMLELRAWKEEDFSDEPPF
jgi:hypothetical protein